MKNNIMATVKSIAWCIAFTGILSSCKKNAGDVIAPPVNDNSLPSAAIANVQLLEKSGNSIRFAVNVAVFRDSRNMENGLRLENFIMDTLRSGGTYSFRCNNVVLGNAQSPARYSALMLMDQSGSIGSTDPDDYRLDAAKAFCTRLGIGDNVMLWSFAGSSYQQYGTGFTTDTSAVIAQIESLRNQHGGGTPLYKSQIAVTDYCATNAPNTNKALMTFTDGQNTQSGYTSEQVSANAIAKNIRLYNVGLGSAETEMLCRQAVATGGAFMFARDARQLISMFGNLGKLLDNSARYYQTQWTVSRNANFSSGNLSHQIRIMMPNGNEVLVPFTLDY